MKPAGKWQDCAEQLKLEQDRRFYRKGITVAVLSGMCYGLYSAFLTLGMASGIWMDWLKVQTAALSAFFGIYMLSAMGSAINDTMSALWCLLTVSVKGKFGDFLRTLRSRPGVIMMAASLIGGPIASSCYVIALQQVGSIAIPISALCPAFGAILARIFFKQMLHIRMVIGICTCFAASFLIAMTSLDGGVMSGTKLGLLLALVAAFGWGLEGCIAGFGTSMIDYQICITIRQLTSGLSNMMIMLPILSMASGMNAVFPLHLLTHAYADRPSIVFFMISGLFAMFAYGLWYKGNGMCGTALGMACNGAFSFWGPFFCWIILGLVCGQEGWAIPAAGWIGAVVMVIGIFIIAMNPLDLIRRKKYQ